MYEEMDQIFLVDDCGKEMVQNDNCIVCELCQKKCKSKTGLKRHKTSSSALSVLLEGHPLLPLTAQTAE
ncbi:hypothetical protein P5673_007819 [Acropora cervicornis]|uniref:C2H2-type domain-containing protein n=1 Tax=Acropora cervicornis TaxID=6130 RepID=A0AAD9QV26_ACRCE|nr:hypothetical protein P5673_007819 [Acropora cervicornis]